MINSLQNIVDKIKTTGGFEVYAHDGTPSFEKTDVPSGYSLTAENLHIYRRASYNLKDPFSINTFSDNSFFDIGGRPTSYEPHLGMVTNGVVSKLGKKIVESSGPLVTKQTPQKGILGYLGFKKNESVRENLKTPRLVKEGWYNLSQIVNTKLDSPACCVITNLLSDFKDGSGRINGNPNLIVYGTSELRGQIFDFLKTNPQQYNEYHRALLSKDLFPNIHRTMVAPMREPSEIAFLVCNSKLENMPREANGYMAKEIGRKYGQIVKVK